MKENIIGVIAVLALLLGGYAVFQSGSVPFGAATAPTGMLIEQYVPVVQYNGGLKTALPISQTSSATTTLFEQSTSATQGWCVQFNATSTLTLNNLTFAASSSNLMAASVIPVVGFGACN